MEKQKQNFLRILSAYVNNTPVILNEPDFKEIFRLAKINSLEAIVYSTLKQNKITPEDIDIKRLEVTFNTTVAYSVKQEYVAKELIKLLNDNEIRHIIFKGYVIKHLYKDPELRTMGDIDIIIDKENKERVFEMLTVNGFEFDEYSSHSEVYNYKKNGVLFEIHTQLFENEFFDGISLKERYRDCFAFVEHMKGYTYEFDVNEHFIYIVVHMAKHFVDSGCGIRMLLDTVFYLKKHFDEIDWEYVNSVSEDLGIATFLIVVLSVAQKSFDAQYPYSEFADNTASVIEYMINGGVFGYEDKNLDAIRIGGKNNSVMDRLINMLRIIFPSHKELQRRYSWAINIPKWLLPFGWVKMWWFRLFKQKEKSFTRIKAAFANRDDAVKHTEMMKFVGLRKDEK